MILFFNLICILRTSLKIKKDIIKHILIISFFYNFAHKTKMLSES